MSLQVEALLEQILDELKGLREDFRQQVECVIQGTSQASLADAAWYLKQNSLGE